MVATDSSQSVSPYHSLMPMQPRPCAETVSWPREIFRTSVLVSVVALPDLTGPSSRRHRGPARRCRRPWSGTGIRRPRPRCGRRAPGLVARGGEPGLHAVEAGRVGLAGGMQQRTSGESVGAQPVQDRAIEAGPRRKPGVRVQWVAVAAEAVQHRLIFPRLVADQVIRSTVRRAPGFAVAPRPAKTAFAPDEQGRAGLGEQP